MKRKFTDIFLIIFPLTALVFGTMTYFLLNFKSQGQQGLWMAGGLGMMCGVVFGVGVGYFVRSLEYDFDIDPSIDISARLQLLLLEMGYRVDNQFQKVITFKPTVRAGIFSDRIRVELVPGHVRIEGPHWHIEKLRAELRV